MTTERLSGELETAIMTGRSLRQIVAALRDLRGAGVSRQEVERALQGLRSRAPDEAAEDRILEVMDVVSGFCRREDTVWED
jgi:hypothetical protein